LLRSAHHIVTDGPSWNIFLHDLAHIYGARLRGKNPSLLPLAIRYADYSAWERERWPPVGEPLHQAAAWRRRELDYGPRSPGPGPSSSRSLAPLSITPSCPCVAIGTGPSVISSPTRVTSWLASRGMRKFLICFSWKSLRPKVSRTRGRFCWFTGRRQWRPCAS